MYREDSQRLEKILANHIYGEGLVPRIYKNLPKFNNQKTSYPIKNGWKYMKTGSTSLVTKEMQIKPTM